jgi:hypothetical protein
VQGIKEGLESAEEEVKAIERGAQTDVGGWRSCREWRFGLRPAQIPEAQEVLGVHAPLAIAGQGPTRTRAVQGAAVLAAEAGRRAEREQRHQRPQDAGPTGRTEIVLLIMAVVFIMRDSVPQRWRCLATSVVAGASGDRRWMICGVPDPAAL